jgi:GDPmannose 4,6-dehydratase
VREFVELSFKEIGKEIVREWAKESEVGKDKTSGKILIRIDPNYYRPSEVDLLLWNPLKAKQKLWREAKITHQEMIQEMIKYDIQDHKK